MLASLCFYGAGLLMNDLADEAEDRRDRPSRPLPSGAARRGSVIAVTVALSALGLGILAATRHPGALLAGIGVLVAVTCYNYVTKGWPIIGALNMGACRTLSILIGALCSSTGSWKLGILPAVFLGLYIAAVTNLARHETKPSAPLSAKLLPIGALSILSFGGISYALFSSTTLPAIGFFALAMAFALWTTLRLCKKPQPPVPPMIGAFIRLLLPLQAAFCYCGDPYPWEIGVVAAFVLIALWPISRAVSKAFYAS